MNELTERAVIGCILMDESCMKVVYERLKPDMFLNPLLRKAYTEIVRAYDIGDRLTVLGIAQKLEDGSITRESIVQELKGCLDSIYSSTEIGKYREILLADYKTRCLKDVLSKARPAPGRIEQQIGELMHSLEALRENRTQSIHSLGEVVDTASGRYFRESDGRRILTGFPKLDDITGGLEGGDMIVIGARPAVGKSAFISQIALHMAGAGLRVGFYNLEMSDKQVYERLLSNVSKIGLTRIRRAKGFLGDEKERFQKANDALAAVDMHIRSGAVSASEIRSECRHLGLDCLIIDYIQLLRADVRYQSRASEVGAISKAIKALAMELDIPIIALSQLNRVSEQRENKEPTMGELREAGDIEQDASIIMLMWNLDSSDRSGKGLKVDKNRQGELGKIVYRFNGDEMRFDETEETIKSATSGFRPAKEPTPFD